MASVDSGTNNPNDPNNPNNVPGNVSQPGQTNQPATTGGAGGVTSTGAGNVTGQVVGPANPSQSFQNIASYLAANAPGGKQLASQVAGTVSQPITQTGTDIANAADTFTGAVNKGYTPENNDLIGAVSKNPAYVAAENPDNVTNFKANLNDVYTGPTDFTQAPGYNNLESEIANAQGLAANTQSESGIQSLLKSVEGPTTAGINKLDSLLLSTDPTNTKTIQDAGAGAANLTPTLTNTTQAENALAATGTTNASTAAADALAALNTAQGTESTNLTGEQSSIQDIVNQYNQSVGVINPVVQTITQAISDFFKNNPNVQMPTSGDPLADIKNLTSIVMPELATYASPEDYAQIAALTQLGDANVSNLPISGATAGQAQTFNVPTALQDAIGKAPGVEKALQDLLTGVGGNINAAVQPFQTTQDEANRTFAEYTADNKQIADLTKQLGAIPQTIFDKQAGRDMPNPAYQAIQGQIKTLQDQASVDAQKNDADKSTLASLAQQLQWVNGTETSYQQLVDAINTQLGKLGSVGVPNLTYGPNAAPAIKTGTPIGQITKDTGNAAGIATGVGTAGAAGVGEAAGISAAQAASAADLAEAMGTTPEAAAALQAGEAGTTGTVLPGVASGLQLAGPAALAAYGTSNIVQNTLKNPIQAGLMDLANTGLSLATLSLPPQIFSSIGKDISNVLNDVGKWFGGLF